MEALALLQDVFDILLGFGLLWLAWLALFSLDLFRSIVSFISFGLLMAIIWVRLDAPDVALAEAAIGAGLTGALFLAAFAKLQPASVNGKGSSINPQKQSSRKQLLRWLPALIMLWIASGLTIAILALPPHATGLTSEVTSNLTASGVSNPVTAVLLNFRGYDTLLEIVVLLLALLAVWSIGSSVPSIESEPGPVLDTLSRLLVPILIMVSAYLLWVGAHAPGGAFQAGAVLGAAGVLLVLSGWKLYPGLEGFPLRLVLTAGSITFVVIAILTMLVSGTFMQFPPAQASILILILEMVATLSIGVTLAALFIGSPPTDIKKL
ncbi:MAG: DUF4040 domain-containing protein [Gammaproteobacteria bacterium]|nr:DUF4040 domain-containing protein [Gammaproteobacteria bacterium]